MLLLVKNKLNTNRIDIFFSQSLAIVLTLSCSYHSKQAPICAVTVSIAFIIWPIKLCDLLMTVPVTELRFSFAEGGSDGRRGPG